MRVIIVDHDEAGKVGINIGSDDPQIWVEYARQAGNCRVLYALNVRFRPEYLASPCDADECDCPACRAQRRKMAH